MKVGTNKTEIQGITEIQICVINCQLTRNEISIKVENRSDLVGELGTKNQINFYITDLT